MIPTPLLILAPMLIMLVGIASFVLLRTTKDDKALLARIESVTAVGRPRIRATTPSLTRRDTKVRPGWRESMTLLMGFSMSRKDQFTLAWGWVLLIALVAGRVAVMLGAGMFGPIAWVLMPVVTVAVSRSMFKTMALKRVTKLRAQLPDGLALIVRAVRVGVPVSEALRVVARESMEPTAGEFGRLADQINIGMPMDQALRQMSERNSLPEYGFLAAALSLQATTGGGLSETLDLLADVTRKRVAMRARGHALSAEARTSSMILGGLPLVSGGALYAINPDYIGLLFTDETGRMVLGAALLSLSTGVFVMRTIIRKSLS